MNEIPNYPGWTPRSVSHTEQIAPAPFERLLALLDHAPTVVPDTLRPLAHWLYHLPQERQSDIGPDGHPRKGGFLPPVPAPRRMWAGGRIDFIAALPVDALATRTSNVISITVKDGRSGRLTFVTVRHEISAEGEIRLVEEQDLVYREAPGISPSAAPGLEPRPSDFTRSIDLDITALFRFSALTFNAHRIHYDLGYATREEGYPGLVVHGPYQATLLIDHLISSFPAASITHFSFRGICPLIADAPFDLCATRSGNTIDLWTRDSDGHECMQAQAELR
ncbi:acyl-CoA dehydrogenase [Sphingobium sp.]|uniref:acyl-CoA dehydrogenase n=1 Tax=Sphingobium sp. TaxID=1912891 RepID=UPI0028BD5D46|nr:acyl-CoA dehydrogenase [Sphingobium sp.]